MTKGDICFDSRHLRNLRSEKPRHHTKKGRTLRFAPTRHTARCLLMADRTAFLFFEGITSPLRSALPPLKGGWGDVPLRSVCCHSERSEESLFFVTFGLTQK